MAFMIVLPPLVGCLWREWKQDDLPLRSAYIAYSAIFTLPALAIVIITGAGWLVGERAVTEELMERVTVYAGADIADLLLRAAENLRLQSDSPLLLFTGASILLFSSLNLLRALRRALRAILGVQVDAAGSGVWKLVSGYALSFVLLLIFIALLITSVVLGAALTYARQQLSELIDLPLAAIGWTNAGVTFFILTLLVASLYRLLPGKRFAPRSLLLCAALTAALMQAVSWAFSSILSQFPIGQAYGVASGVLVLLMLIYVLALIFLLGAELLDCLERAALNSEMHNG